MLVALMAFRPDGILSYDVAETDDTETAGPCRSGTALRKKVTGNASWNYSMSVKRFGGVTAVF